MPIRWSKGFTSMGQIRMQWIRVGWAILSLASLSFAQWQKTLKEICHSLFLPSFPSLHFVQLKNPPISLPSPSVGRSKVLTANLPSPSPTKKEKPSTNSVLTLPSGTKASSNNSKNASSFASVLSFPTVNGTFFIGVYLAMGLPSRGG